jgi:hypothetical protein
MVYTMKDYDINMDFTFKVFLDNRNIRESTKVIMSTTSKLLPSHTKNTNRIYQRSRNKRRLTIKDEIGK